MSNNIVFFNGGSHRGPGPWSVETFRDGMSIVVNGQGINWLHWDEKPGAKFSSTEHCKEIANELNSGQRINS